MLRGLLLLLFFYMEKGGKLKKYREYSRMRVKET